MALVRGCEIPDHLHYHVEHNVWVQMLPSGDIRIGMTSYACSLSGEIVAITPKKVGKHVKKDRSCATVESGKWVGPVKLPVAGEVVQINPMVGSDPGIINRDPYGEGWIAIIKPDDWAADCGELLTGDAALQALENKMDQDGFGGC